MLARKGLLNLSFFAVSSSLKINPPAKIPCQKGKNGTLAVRTMKDGGQTNGNRTASSHVYVYIKKFGRIGELHRE